MKVTLGYSPCPNDTFIFDALVNKKISTAPYEFETVLEDIQTLNQWASEARLDITKLSFPAFFQNQHQYTMLQAGAAMGKGVGPLLIAKQMVKVPNLLHSTIAIPGLQTTANLLLNFAFPMAKKKVPMLFSEIEDAVLMDKVDLGVIIHENRFTYEQKHLIKICDLGEIWEQRQQLPVPLACIAIRSNSGITRQVADDISNLIKKSIEYAFSNYPSISDYTKQHAQEMDENVMRQHIELYVNDFSLDITTGKPAIEELYKQYQSIQ